MIYCFLVLPIFCLVPVSVRVCLYWWVSVSRSLSFSLYLRSVSMIIFSNLSTTPFALPIALSIAPYTGTLACAALRLPIWKLGRRFFNVCPCSLSVSPPPLPPPPLPPSPPPSLPPSHGPSLLPVLTLSFPLSLSLQFERMCSSLFTLVCVCNSVCVCVFVCVCY